MSGGGEVRVLLQEAGQESPRMPAWKREILERRKAKSGVSGGAGAAETVSPGGAAPQRANGELTGSVNGGGGARSDGGGGGGANGGSGRNYTITTATQHFAHNKEPRPMATERTLSREDDSQESLVLQESLGPLEENPFIKLEKERRRRQDQENTSRPVQHILELYGSVPGIRTIRAENIIIIESDPDYFQEGKGGPKWQQNGVSGYSSLNDLLDRRGSAVTEIRAKEVVIYDTTLSKSEENLSTLGRPDRDASYEAGEGQGRVSRMLQKFDSNYGKLQKKSHSTENLLDLDCSPSGSSSSRLRPWPKSQPDLVPKPRPGPSVSSPGGSQPSSPVFHSPWSPKAKPQPAAVSPLGSPKRLPGSPQPVSSFRQRFGDNGASSSPRDEPDRGQNKLTKDKEWEGTDASPKPKVPCSPESLRPRAESSSSQVSYKLSGDYEIRPSPKPDLAEIPDGDVQARALANLRLQSKNSFTVIPKRQLSASSAGGSPTLSSPIKDFSPHKAAEVSSPGVPSPRISSPDVLKRLEEKKIKTPARPSEPKPSSSFPTSPSPTRTSEPCPPSQVTPASTPPPPAEAPSSSSAAVPNPTPSPSLKSPAPAPSSPVLEEPPVDHLPVTNIDDIEVEPPLPRGNVPAPSPVASRRKGNTFTVVPKRRAEPGGQTDSPEPQQEGPSKAPPGSTPPQAPYSQLGSLIKKRYPAVDEIEVIGGYLSLEKSCLCKTGSTGKKLKISFNESSLHSTYEYPSESSVWDSSEEEEEEEKAEERAAAEEEQPSMVGRIHIPRPTFTTSPIHKSNGSDLSSYVPKHAMDFSTWQEHKHNNSISTQEDSSGQQSELTQEVMLTPADSSSLTDYSSEPALYF